MAKKKNQRHNPCRICCRDYIVPDSESLEKCGHFICRDCKYQLVAPNLNSLQFYKIRCTCGSPLQFQDICRLVQLTRKQKTQFKQIAYGLAHPNSASPCTQCGWFNRRYVPDSFMLSCSKCSHQYCFQHGDAHFTDMTWDGCLAFQEKQANLAEEKLTQRWIQQETKYCPQCHAHSKKQDGCNLVTCLVCRTPWCYGCGHRQGTLEHYQACRSDHSYPRPRPDFVICTRVFFSVFLCVVFLALASVTVVELAICLRPVFRTIMNFVYVSYFGGETLNT